MKKMFCLVLLFIVLGTASMNAQVRIGGMENPAPGAVLDLNKDEGTNDKGLLLPKVALQSSTDNTTVGPHTSGMVVYNIATAGDVTPGFYYNNASAWVRMDDGTSIATDAIDSTNIKNGTVGLEDIRDNIISSEKIMDGTIKAEDLSSMGAETKSVLAWNGSGWVPQTWQPALFLKGTTTCSVPAGQLVGKADMAALAGCAPNLISASAYVSPGDAHAYTSIRDGELWCVETDTHAALNMTYHVYWWCVAK